MNVEVHLCKESNKWLPFKQELGMDALYLILPNNVFYLKRW